MLTCREIARAVAAENLQRASFVRRLEVRLHFLGCRHCRRYAAQIRAIGECARQLFRETPASGSTLERLRRSCRGARLREKG